MASQFLSLSLFIMLLSFFIILNGMSDFHEEKTKAVQQSLSLAFSVDFGESGLNPAVSQGADEAVRSGDALDRVEGLFRAQIANISIQKSKNGRQMKIEAPVTEFAAALMSVGRNVTGLSFDQDPALNGNFGALFVSFLEASAEQSYQMDIILQGADDSALSDQGLNPRQLAQIRQVSRFAERLENLGFPASSVSAGIGAGKEGMVEIIIRKYVPLNISPENIFNGVGGSLAR